MTPGRMLARMGAPLELFHTATGIAFADLLIEGHRETWPVRSKRFRAWLRRCHYEKTGGPAGAGTISTALDWLEARAQFDGPERDVHLRVAERNRHLYLDLADKCWRAVEIGPEGWRVIGSPPVRFRRTTGMLPIPTPVSGGSINDLKACLNVSANDFVLIVAWLLAALRPSGPYPLLAIAGEQGSAKTVTSKMLKALLDPNAAPVRALVREERELMIAAQHAHLLAFDNVSAVPLWLSDAFCRLASGGSLAIRQLFTDDEQVLFQAARPILLNGIEEVVGRPDLADRTLFVTLPSMDDERRRLEAALWQEFELGRPRILGVFLDAVAHGLRAAPRIRLKRLPRMADFALWAAACETAFWPAGTFARTYERSRRAMIESIVEADPVAACVRDLVVEQSTWRGSATDLLRLGPNRDDAPWNASIGWPKNPRALAGRLRRTQVLLRALGIDISFRREGRAGTRIITIRKRPELTVDTGAACRR